MRLRRTRDQRLAEDEAAMRGRVEARRMTVLSGLSGPDLTRAKIQAVRARYANRPGAAEWRAAVREKRNVLRREAYHQGKKAGAGL